MPANKRKISFTWFKNWDIFGHRISMNFDNKSPTHNTFIGAFFTLFIYGVIIAMVTFKTIRIINY